MDLPMDAPETPLHALLPSLLTILVSEIGDKTFLIAALLAMRHPRLRVFLGAFLALALMSLLSASLGHLLPAMVPRRWTQWSAAALFGVFGVRMWREARAMEGGGEGGGAKGMEEEMREAEEEIDDDDKEHEGALSAAVNGEFAIPLEDMEEGHSAAEPGHSHPSKSKQKNKSAIADGARNFFSLFLGPVFVQAFILTFLGEWGDRSQIATIALGAAHNVYIVTLGTVLGHACCTALAVVGGRYVSTKISVKHVTYIGSILFLLFGLIYLYEGFAASAADSLPLGSLPLPIDVDIGIPVPMDGDGGVSVER